MNKLEGFYSRLRPGTGSQMRAIATRRGEKVQDTVQKAFDQYIAADKRRKSVLPKGY